MGRINPIRLERVNVYSICDYRTIECLIEYRLIMSQLANVSISENFDNIFITDDLKCVPFKGRYFDVLRLLISQSALLISVVDKMLSDT